MKTRLRIKNWAIALCAALTALVLTGCGHDHDHDDHDDHDHGAHVHHAPHGGALTMLGDHVFQLEVLPDAEKRTVSIYVLDGEAERFIRIAAESISAKFVAGDESSELQLAAVANSATGETIGNTSLFVVSAPDWAGRERFKIQIDRLEILGQVFEGLELPFPEGKH